MKIAVFIGSIREGRAGITVGNWSLDQLQARGDGRDYHLLDLKEQDLNPLTTAKPPAAAQGTYDDPQTQGVGSVRR